MGNVSASLIIFWRSSAEATQASKRETRTESTMAAQGGQEERGLLMMEGAAPIADQKEVYRCGGTHGARREPNESSHHV